VGTGLVDGFTPYVSSTQAELTGLTDLTIIICLLSDFHSTALRAILSSDSQGAINKLQSFSTHRLRHHHEANINLLLPHCLATSNVNISGHADKHPWKMLDNLKNQGLSLEKVYNVWCDSLATQARLSDQCFAPVFNPDVTLAEKWAVYSHHPIRHKVIGYLSMAIKESLGYSKFVKVSYLFIYKSIAAD